MAKSEAIVGVYPKGDGWGIWVSDPFHGGKTRRFSGYTTKREAVVTRELVIQTSNAVLAGLPIDVPGNVVDVVHWLASGKRKGMRKGEEGTQAHTVKSLITKYLQVRAKGLTLPRGEEKSLSQKQYDLEKWALAYFENWCVETVKDGSLHVLSEERLDEFRSFVDERIASAQSRKHVLRIVAKMIYESWEKRRGLKELPRNLPSFKKIKVGEGVANPMTVEHFAVFYTHATEEMKLFMLLALNCAYTQNDISRLTHSMVDLTTGRIERVREKTQKKAATPMYAKLWKRTLDKLKEQATQPDGDNLVLLSTIGEALVRPEVNSDSVSQMFTRLKKQKELKGIQGKHGPYSFRDIRSMGASMIKNQYVARKGKKTKSNSELFDLYLAHKPPAMNRPYDDGDWTELFYATDWLGKQFESALAALEGGNDE